MREILFRGKREDGEGWVYGHYHNTTYTGYPNGGNNKITRHYILPQNAGDAYVVIPETVGQYIGKKDKNRKKIFEGDIVQTIKTEFDPPRKYRKPYQVHYNSDFPSAVEEYYSPFEHFTEKVAYEVIGNIHDNPELLEGDDNG